MMFPTRQPVVRYYCAKNALEKSYRFFPQVREIYGICIKQFAALALVVFKLLMSNSLVEALLDFNCPDLAFWFDPAFSGSLPQVSTAASSIYLVLLPGLCGISSRV